MRLLGVPATKAPKVKQQVLDSVGIIKPGSCRLSLTFLMSDAEVSGVTSALEENLRAHAYSHIYADR